MVDIMNKPHKHADLIKAWADGAEVEYFSSWHSKWVPCPSPLWDCDKDYRIKPEPKPDYVEKCSLHMNLSWRYGQPPEHLKHAHHYVEVGEFKLTFDGETGKLKAAEVIA